MQSLITREKYRKAAFTLAEVLIALAVIGVVAALTIPLLVNNMREDAFKSAYKKAFSVVSQATLAIKSDNNGSLVGVFSDNTAYINSYVEKLDTISVCLSNCTFDGISAYTGQANAPGSIVFKDGLKLASSGLSSQCDDSGAWKPTMFFGQPLCGEFYIDVNGNKKPNSAGKDIFWVGITAEGKVIPAGIPSMVNASWKCPNGEFCNSYKYLY